MIDAHRLDRSLVAGFDSQVTDIFRHRPVRVVLNPKIIQHQLSLETAGFVERYSDGFTFADYDRLGKTKDIADQGAQSDSQNRHMNSQRPPGPAESFVSRKDRSPGGILPLKAIAFAAQDVFGSCGINRA